MLNRDKAVQLILHNKNYPDFTKELLSLSYDYPESIIDLDIMKCLWLQEFNRLIGLTDEQLMAEVLSSNE